MGRCCGNHQIIRDKLNKKIFLLGNNLKQKKTTENVTKMKDLKVFQSNKNIDYSKMKELNVKWENFMIDFLEKDQSQEAILNKVLKADFHGAHIRVIKCLN